MTLQQEVYFWLGYYRDRIPDDAVLALQRILGTLEMSEAGQEPCQECGAPMPHELKDCRRESVAEQQKPRICDECSYALGTTPGCATCARFVEKQIP